MTPGEAWQTKYVSELFSSGLGPAGVDSSLLTLHGFVGFVDRVRNGDDVLYAFGNEDEVMGVCFAQHKAPGEAWVHVVGARHCPRVLEGVLACEALLIKNAPGIGHLYATPKSNNAPAILLAKAAGYVCEGKFDDARELWHKEV